MCSSTFDILVDVLLGKCLSKLFTFLGVLKEITQGCAVGQSVRELCVKADALLVEETGKAFKKDKKVQKGKFLLV